MVLRRPYAFMIKHFKLLHLIITFLLGFVAYKTSETYSYINEVIKDTIRRYDALSHIHFGTYIFIFLALALCYAVYWLLKYKDKPRKIYIITIAGYAIMGIFFYILFIYVENFVHEIPETKTIRLYRDIMMMLMVFQYYFVVLYLIRGLGFNLKKFNFASDLQELNLNESDSAEVEIDTRIDTTNVNRFAHKKLREFGYFYKEFKLYILIIVGVIAIILGIKIRNFVVDTFKVYDEGETVGSTYKFTINNSYFSTINGKHYVIVDFNVVRNSKNDKFNPNTIALYVRKDKYYPNKTICNKFNNLGTCYRQQTVTYQGSNYIVAYEVKDLNHQKTYVNYTDSFDNEYRIKLEMKTPQ